MYALLSSNVARFCNTLITHIPFMHYECKDAFKTHPAGLKHQQTPAQALSLSLSFSTPKKKHMEATFIQELYNTSKVQLTQ